MIPFTNSQKENQSNHKQNICYICKYMQIFVIYVSTDDKNYYKVKDHCHYIGKYRRAAHNIYNLRYKTLKEIPVVFNNCSKFYNQRASSRI